MIGRYVYRDYNMHNKKRYLLISHLSGENFSESVPLSTGINYI
jgi:hypothetical protein